MSDVLMSTKKSHMVKLMEGHEVESETNEEEFDPNDLYSMRRMAFPRTFTDPLANAIDFIAEGDGKVAQTIVDNLHKFDDHGPDGDIPEQPAFAADVIFWKIVALGIILGGSMGLLGLGFMNVIDENYWILVTTGSGLLVGLIRWGIKYPDGLPGFFKEVNSCHVDPHHAPATIILSAISIAGGANLGPEQAMGTCGGGFATFMAERMTDFSVEDKQLLVLTGMSGAMGALFPTPLLAVLIIHELGNPPRSFMESTLLLSISGITSFLAFYGVEGVTFLSPLEATPQLYALSYDWDFQLKHCGDAILFGIVSAALALCCLVSIGIVKQLFSRIKDRLDTSKSFLSSEILLPTLGGLLIGLVNVALPLTVGNGNMISKTVVKEWQNYSTHLLISTGFGRMFTLAVSMNCGMVGGFVFPVITIGLIAGTICHQQYEDIPLGMCVTCFLAAVPASICPMPFTLVCLSCFLFFLGLQQTIPVFISCITAYLLFTGMGIMGALQARAQEQDKLRKERLRKQKEKESIGSVKLTDGDLKRVPSRHGGAEEREGSTHTLARSPASFARANSSLGYGRSNTNLDW